MDDLFIIEGIMETGNAVYFDLEDDDYYTCFIDSIAGATIFDNKLFRLCYNIIKEEAQTAKLVKYYKRLINPSLLVLNID